MLPVKEIVRRILISLGIGLLIGVAIGEIPFIFQRETARMPQMITITIPPGTADRVALGEAPPSIPENMTFVVGDVLVVENNDAVDHKLGPLWIPANTSAQLALSQKENLAYTKHDSNPPAPWGLTIGKLAGATSRTVDDSRHSASSELRHVSTACCGRHLCRFGLRLDREADLECAGNGERRQRWGPDMDLG